MPVQATFKINWTKKGKASETVPGKSYEDMFKFFQKKNAAKQEWGKFSTERPKLSFKPAKGEPLTEVVLDIGYTITLPSWGGASSASKAGKEAWEKMMKALEKHEDNHRLILLEQCAIFGEKIAAEKDLTLKKLGELFAQFPKDVKAAQDKYDDATGHGEKEGVFLPAPDKVK